MPHRRESPSSGRSRDGRTRILSQLRKRILSKGRTRTPPNQTPVSPNPKGRTRTLPKVRARFQARAALRKAPGLLNRLTDKM